MGLRLVHDGEERFFEPIAGSGRVVTIRVEGSEDAVTLISAEEGVTTVVLDYFDGGVTQGEGE